MAPHILQAGDLFLGPSRIARGSIGGGANAVPVASSVLAETDYGWITADSQYALHLTGEDGNGNDPTDSGYYLHSITANNAVACTTAAGAFKFDSGGIDFDGTTGNYIDLPSASVFESTSSDTTTWEGWFRPDGVAASEQLLSAYSLSTDYFHIRQSTTTLTCTLEVGGVVEINISGGTVSAATWHHFRVVNQSGSYEAFLDGVSIGTDTTTATVQSSWTWQVGAENGSGLFTGQMDEVLIIDGAAPSQAVATSGSPLSAATPATTYKYQQASDMVAWYEFEEGSLTVVGDSSDNSNTATASGGMTWETGKVGSYAGGFDGTDDEVDFPTAVISGQTTGSISFWLKVNSNSAATSTLWSYCNNSSATLEILECFIDQRPGSTSQRILFQLYDAGTAAWTLIVPEANYNTTSDFTWHNVTIAHDGVAPVCYLDGVSVGSFSISTDKTKWSSAMSLADKFLIGGRYINGVKTVNLNCSVDMDDTRFYSRALTATEALALYNENA